MSPALAGRLRRLGWFVLLWAAAVLTLAVIALALRLLLGLLQPV